MCEIVLASTFSYTLVLQGGGQYMELYSVAEFYGNSIMAAARGL